MSALGGEAELAWQEPGFREKSDASAFLTAPIRVVPEFETKWEIIVAPTHLGIKNEKGRRQDFLADQEQLAAI